MDQLKVATTLRDVLEIRQAAARAQDKRTLILCTIAFAIGVGLGLLI